MQAAVKSATVPAHSDAVHELHTTAPKPAAAPAAAAPKASANDGFGNINMGNMGGMGMMGSMMPGMGGGGSGKGNKGGTYGVMKEVGGELGLGSLVGGQQNGKDAKPVGKAILDDLKVILLCVLSCI